MFSREISGYSGREGYNETRLEGVMRSSCRHDGKESALSLTRAETTTATGNAR
jgi:hypothetical protein